MIIKSKDFGNGVMAQKINGTWYIVCEVDLNRLPLPLEERTKSLESFGKALDFIASKLKHE